VGAGGKFREGARNLKQQAADKSRQAGARTKETAMSFLDSGKDELAHRMFQVATAVRKTGEQLEQEQDASVLCAPTYSLSERVERASEYLRGHNAYELIGALENAARRRPAIFLGAAFALGLMAARFVKAEPEEWPFESEPLERSAPFAEGSEAVPPVTTSPPESFGV
jgi:hypothetical protein